jgi:hypothetical protein
MGQFNELYKSRNVDLFPFLTENPGIMFRFIRCVVCRFPNLDPILLAHGLEKVKTDQLVEMFHIVSRIPTLGNVPVIYRVKNSKFYTPRDKRKQPIPGLQLVEQVWELIEAELTNRAYAFVGKELWVDRDLESFGRQHLHRGRATGVPDWVDINSSVGDRIPISRQGLVRDDDDLQVIMFIYWVAETKVDIDLSVACYNKVIWRMFPGQIWNMEV